MTFCFFELINQRKVMKSRPNGQLFHCFFCQGRYKHKKGEIATTQRLKQKYCV